ncbi:enoyl-CoA hydratase/isomerase family protein [bacterium]|nr:enoyl-CoA hydratase/isomerase family protein [bacterium]
MPKVSVSVSGGIAEVWIDRPDVHNAFDEEVIRGLSSAFEQAEKDASVRVLVLGGRGKSFSAGADLEWMKRAATFDEGRNQEDARGLARMLRSLARSRLPTIARVHGAALGGGCGLVAACDFAIAKKTASFGFSEVKLGLIPAVISPHVVAKVGPARARELFLLGERFDAERALACGLVSRVVEDDLALDAAVKETCAQLATSSPDAIRAAKDLVRFVSSSPDEERTDDETSKRIARARSSPDGKEGISAFLEKRRPSWHPEASKK